MFLLNVWAIRSDLSSSKARTLSLSVKLMFTLDTSPTMFKQYYKFVKIIPLLKLSFFRLYNIVCLFIKCFINKLYFNLNEACDVNICIFIINSWYNSVPETLQTIKIYLCPSIIQFSSEFSKIPFHSIRTVTISSIKGKNVLKLNLRKKEMKRKFDVKGKIK